MTLPILLNPLAVVALVESTRRKTDARHCGKKPECVIVDRETGFAALLSCDCDCPECNAPTATCGEPLPCGIRKGAWARHVCGLPKDHADVDSPCRCVVCDKETQ